MKSPEGSSVILQDFEGLINTVLLNLAVSNPFRCAADMTHVMQSDTLLYSFDIILKNQKETRMVHPVISGYASGALNLSALHVSSVCSELGLYPCWWYISLLFR